MKSEIGMTSWRSWAPGSHTPQPGGAIRPSYRSSRVCDSRGHTHSWALGLEAAALCAVDSSPCLAFGLRPPPQALGPTSCHLHCWDGLGFPRNWSKGWEGGWGE